jgi:uncharacterized protein YjiS (DUF1127 family)
MTLTLSSIANDGTEHAGAAPADRGLAGALKDLAYEAIRPLRHRMLYNKIIDDLAYLDDEVLYDIGLDREEIKTYARGRAALRWPVRHSLWTALAGVPVALWRALKRAGQRRAVIMDLMMLDDKMLKDIGIARCQIPWIADEMARQERELGSTTGRQHAASNMVWVDRVTDLGRLPTQGPVPTGANAPHRIAPANDGLILKAS